MVREGNTVYPVLIRRVADLRVGDLLIAHSGIRYKNPLRVVGPAGGAHGGGVVVAVQHPGGDDPSELVLQPWSTDGQVLEVDRPSAGRRAPAPTTRFDW